MTSFEVKCEDLQALILTKQSMDETISVSIRNINPNIVCSLCAGYFIDATTITECLHTFCKSCIVKYLQSSKYCPQCNVKIHETQPLIHLKADRTMQDIVFKLVPGLFENEEKRRQEFYKSRGLGREQKQEDENTSPPRSNLFDSPDGHHYSNDEQVCMCLERYSPFSIAENGNTFHLLSLPRKFVRCSVRTAVHHLKKLLIKKLCVPKSLEVEILCNELVLPKEMTMKHVWLSQWTGRPSPLMLFYRVRPRAYLQQCGSNIQV